MIQFTFGQGPVGIDNGVNQIIASIDQMSTGKQQIVSAYIKNPPRNIFGSYYVFEDWDNIAIVQIKEDKPYKINKVNINVKEDRFEAKFGQDSIFAFDALWIDYFLINDRKFKKTYLNKFQEERICEIVVEDEKYMILKSYWSDIKRNDPDPLMLKPNGDEFVINSNYYIKQGARLEKFKLNKRSVLGLFQNNSKAIEAYVREEKLSYNKSEHLKKIYSKWKSLLK